MIDGTETRVGGFASAPVFSHDGKHVGYTGRDDHGRFAMVDRRKLCARAGEVAGRDRRPALSRDDRVSGGETPVGDITAVPLPPGLTLTYDKRRDDGIASIDVTPTVAGRKSLTVDAWCYGTNRPGQTGKHVYELVVH